MYTTIHSEGISLLMVTLKGGASSAFIAMIPESTENNKVVTRKIIGKIVLLSDRN
jgi:hypothetical protein